MPIPASPPSTSLKETTPRGSACWAHLRRVRDRLEPVAAGRSLFDVHKETGCAIAQEALQRIGDLYDIEARIVGQSAEVRHAVRQKESRPKVEAFKVWAEAQLRRIPGKSDLARAFRHALNRWDSFCLFLDDGRVAIDNNPAERKMKPIAPGRKNFLFAGSDAGGETRAAAMTIIEPATDNGLDPQAYLTDIFTRIHDQKINRIDDLLPWNCKPAHAPKAEAV